MSIFISVIVVCATGLWFNRTYIKQKMKLLLTMIANNMAKEITKELNMDSFNKTSLENHLDKFDFFSQSKKTNTVISDYEKDNNCKIVNMLPKTSNSSSFWSILENISGSINQQITDEIMGIFNDIPQDQDIVLFLHTNGGSLLYAQMICNVLMNHTGKITVIIPQYALSAGTLITLCADEVIMHKNASLSPIDVQMGNFPITSIRKGLDAAVGFIAGPMRVICDKIEKDENLLTNIFEKIVKHRKTKKLQEISQKFTDALIDGNISHSTCFTTDNLISDYNFKVNTEGFTTELQNVYKELKCTDETKKVPRFPF